MMHFSMTQGMVLIIVYGLIAFGVSLLFAHRRNQTKSFFLLADRKLGLFEGAFSISATWIWAPALFISAREAYLRGITGLFWFLVPNIVCLIIFSRFARRIRKRIPNGITLSDYIATQYSKRVQKLYWIELVGLGVCSFAVQLLAGAGVISLLTGLPFFVVTLTLTLIALSYSLFSGLKSSVVTDYLQMGIMLVVSAVLVPWVLSRVGGVSSILDSLGGVSGEYANLFNAKGMATAWSFGVPVTIGLLAGPFGDQSFWQRAFAIREKAVAGAFVMGAFIFALVPLLLSLLGFAAVALQLEVNDPQYVNIEIVEALLPTWALVAFIFMLLSGLASTLDSNLCSISSIVGHDLFKKAEDKDVVKVSRYAMLLMAAAALLIANIPGLKILYLFLFYGTLRASTLIPTILSLSRFRIAEAGVFWGILCALIVGVPMFTYGKLTGNVNVAVWGAILTVSFSGLVAIGYSLLNRETQQVVMASDTIHQA